MTRAPHITVLPIGSGLEGVDSVDFDVLVTYFPPALAGVLSLLCLLITRGFRVKIEAEIPPKPKRR